MSLAAQRLRENEIERKYYTGDPSRETKTQTKRRITKGEKVLWVMGLITIFVFCLVIVSNESALYNKTKQVGDLQTKIDQMASENTGLSTQIAKLSAPERIIQYAETQLGLTINVNNVKVVK